MEPIIVLDKHGKPLDPSVRPGHIRQLLKEGKAVAIKTHPFTVRLKYGTTGITHRHHVGIDPGRENIGVSVSKQDGECEYLEDMETHNRNIKKQMADRAANRRGRRRHHRQSKQRKAVSEGTTIQNGKDDVCRTTHECKSVDVSYPGAEKPVTHKIIQGKEGKFNNRIRKPNWVTPSATQVCQMLINAVIRMKKNYPVTDVHIERNAFDFQKLADYTIHDWNHGPLFGFKNYKEAIYAEQDGKCLMCGGKIDHYHHIRPRENGRKRNDHLSNIAGLCRECHDRVHKDADFAQQLAEKKIGSYQQFQVGLLNSVIPLALEMFGDWCRKNGIKLHITDGQATADTRKQYGLQKDHCIDAYAISLSDRIPKYVSLPDKVYHAERFKKKQNAMTSKVGSRTYWYNGKQVATNRHKAEGQMSDSLEEYLDKYSQTHSHYETAVHAHELEARPAERVYTYRKERLSPPIHKGDVIEVVKRNKKGVITFKTKTIAKTVRMCGEGSVEGTDGKTYTMKFCRRIGSGAVQITGWTDIKVWLKKVHDDEIKFAKKKSGRKRSISLAA